jgi:rhamnosyltransferase
MHDYTCGITVTFHPDETCLDNLKFVREQVDCSVVVDNGSEEAELASLRAICKRLGVHLIENGSNLGIAAALNQGVRWAKARGCAYVVLFDQDSRPFPSFVEKSLSVFTSGPTRGKIAIVAPSLIDVRRMIPLCAVRYQSGEPLVAQTSGSLMPVRVFDEVGWFDESFFIDLVDYDYCLRLKDRGWSIAECKAAVMLHQPGNVQVRRLFGLKSVTTSNFAAPRRYYRTRNDLWMLRLHGRRYLRFCLALNYANFKDLLKIAWEQQRLNKWRSAISGLFDGFWTLPLHRCSSDRARG